MAKDTKRQKKINELVETGKEYSVEEALELVAEKLPRSKFDETLEVAIKLGVDPRKADENVRSTVSLPNGTGKVVRVLAICKGDNAKEAEEAGADFVGAEDMVAKIQDGWLDFDAVVVTPDMMAQVGKVGKLLGPRGLMPNPKTGTVTPNIAQAVSAIKGGRVEFRVDKSSIVHVPVGKVSFGSQKLKENFDALLDAIKKSKPKASKGVYLQKINIATTHGPGLALEVSSIR